MGGRQTLGRPSSERNTWLQAARAPLSALLPLARDSAAAMSDPDELPAADKPRKRRKWDEPVSAEAGTTADAAAPDAEAAPRSRWAPADAPPSEGRPLTAVEIQLVEAAATAVARGGTAAEANLCVNPTFAPIFEPGSKMHALYGERVAMHRTVAQRVASLQAKPAIAAAAAAAAAQHAAQPGGSFVSTGGGGRVFYPPSGGGMLPVSSGMLPVSSLPVSSAPPAPVRGALPVAPEGGGFSAAPGGIGRVFFPPPASELAGQEEDASRVPEEAPAPAPAPAPRPRSERRRFREEAPERAPPPGDMPPPPVPPRLAQPE